MILKNIAIVVMDVGDPNVIKFYNSEEETNKLFIRYLNSRLWQLKKQGAKIIECNYLGKRHPLITVDFDFVTTKMKRLKKYLIKNGIKTVVYTGLHYSRCIHIARETSGVFLLKETNINVYACPFLSRPLASDYWKTPHVWEPELPIINL